jgi:hypothetical protein
MASPDARPLDVLRQIAVLSAVSFMLVAAALGTGLLGGTSVEDVQGGALDSDASYLAPAAPAFSIWSVIYLGLIAYAIWQALPSQRGRARHRELGWFVALTAVLNGLWLVAARFWSLPLTVVVIMMLLAALAVTFRVAVLTRTPDDGGLDAVLLDGVTGLHLGWVSLATVANIAAWLTQTAPPEWSAVATPVGIGVLALVGAIGLVTAWASGWRMTPGIAVAWGAAWVAVGRLSGEPANGPIGVTALIVAVVLGLVPLAVAGLRLLRPQGD